MLKNIAFIHKEIYLFGKKEVHNVLCLGIETENGETYYKPLSYSKKGKDGNYYNTYIVKDNLQEVVIVEFANVPKLQ